MQENAILLQNLNSEQLKQLVKGVFKSEFNDYKKSIQTQNLVDELLLPDEVCKIFKINRSTLWRWEQKNKVQSCGIEGKRYFLRSQLLSSLKPLTKI